MHMLLCSADNKGRKEQRVGKWEGHTPCVSALAPSSTQILRAVEESNITSCLSVHNSTATPEATNKHGVKSFLHLCPARAITGESTMVAHGSWSLATGQTWGGNHHHGQRCPWSGPSPAYPGEMSFSGDTWTGQGGWKRPTHIVLPPTDPQVA